MSDLLYNPKSLTVMIVDDHDPIRKGIKRVLTTMGFGEVIECFDGEDAAKYLQKKPIDLLILDLYMRNVSGFELLEYVRNRDIGCDVPVLVVTGEASKEEIVKVADMGAEDYLLKPFQATDLEKKVTKTLNKYYSPTPLLKSLRRAERFYLTSEFPQALESFDAALKLDTASARAMNGKALTLERMGRGDDAVKILQESITNNQSYYKNHSVLADILLKQNKVKDAIEAMRRELEINPKQPERQVQIAKLLLKEGDAMGAVDHYRIALQEDPKRLGALMGMGHAYAMADNLDKALYYFKRVRRYHPNATKALEAAIRACFAANDPRKAELMLKDEKAAHPDRHDTFLLLAMLYMKQEREDDAMALANELLEKDPTHAAALRIKANVFLKKNDHKNALVALETVAKVAPSADVLATMGETLLALTRIPEAMDALNKSIAMNPEAPQAFWLLADAHKRSQQWLKAAHLFKRAAQLGAHKERCQIEARDCQQQVMARRSRPRAAS